MRKFLLFAFLTLLFCSSCYNNHSSSDALVLSDSIVSFDTINAQFDELLFKLDYKNKSKDTVFILGAHPECGCTFVEYSKDTVLSGESGVFEIYYDSYTHSFDVELPIDIKYSYKDVEYEKTIYLTGYVIPRVID